MKSESMPAERRWPTLTAVLIVLGLYLLLPERVLLLPRWVFPAFGLALLVPLMVINPRRLNRETQWSRWLSIAIAAAITLLNQVTVVLTIAELLVGRAVAQDVLLTVLQVWATNVIAFGLVYWELDRGGPIARRISGMRDDAQPDFQFPQQSAGATTVWVPAFVDYLYFSLSNMMAFSPTDVMPLTHRAKGLMGFQAFTGFVLLALVISRAVNIIGPS